MAAVRTCQKLPPRVTKLMPMNYMTDPLWARAKPISDSGNISGITDFKGGKNCCETTAARRDE